MELKAVILHRGAYVRAGKLVVFTPLPCYNKIICVFGETVNGPDKVAVEEA